jgi:hypothetical protein
MFDLGASLQQPLDDAGGRLRAAETAVARANADGAGRATDAAMAQTAQAAIFTEALLGAQHARFEELKAVAK